MRPSAAGPAPSPTSTAGRTAVASSCETSERRLASDSPTVVRLSHDAFGTLSSGSWADRDGTLYRIDETLPPARDRATVNTSVKRASLPRERRQCKLSAAWIAALTQDRWGISVLETHLNGLGMDPVNGYTMPGRWGLSARLR